MSDRYSGLKAFLKRHGLHVSPCNPCDCGCACSGSLEPLSGDASFRKYYRLRVSEPAYGILCKSTKTKPNLRSPLHSVIAVDAPPETQKNAQFVRVNRLLHAAGVTVPAVFDADIENGFLLLEDLGDTLFIDKAIDDERLAFYCKACSTLSKITCLPKNREEAESLQKHRELAASLGKGDEFFVPVFDMTDEMYETIASLPRFDEAFIRTELAICTEWLFEKRLNLELTDAERKTVADAFDFLVKGCLAQPETVMHRDYHSRNIMVTPDGCDSSIMAMPAVIDYQDAVIGPACYDFASLLFDCYTRVDDEDKEYLCDFFLRVLRTAGVLSADTSDQDFVRMVRICALQRHVKVLGLFNRLALRDGKEGYLKDLPFVLDCVIQNCAAFSELADFSEFLERRIRGRI